MRCSRTIEMASLMARALTPRALRALSLVALLSVSPVQAQEPPEDQAAPADAGQEQAAPEASPAAPSAAPTEEAAQETNAPSLKKGASPEEVKALEAYQRAFARYNLESRDYQETIDGIVDAKYRQRVASINQAYDVQINARTAVERQRRQDAIAAFEAFIERYPRHERYTPDALFRLAELYFEKANDDYLVADEGFQDQLNAYEAGRIPDRPPEPERDYDKTVQTFARLISDWPEYRLLDGAYYLLAYCEQQRGNFDEARDLFLALIEKRPDSRFVPEAWVRIGEYYFDGNELEPARDAYVQAMKYPDSRFFDKALYKLAWTYYRQDNFDEAIKRFQSLIEYSDAEEAKTGKSGSVLRAEAVQYMAISLAEEDWDLDGITDNEFGLARVKRYVPAVKPYEREVLAQLANYMFEKNRFEETIDIIRYALEAYPNHPENPQLHEQMVLAMFRSENLNAAFAERRGLGTFYGPGSPWYDSQREQGNVEAMQYAQGLVKDNLIQSATWFHEQAQKERDEAIAQQDESKLRAAAEKYKRASEAYEEFIKKHPNDKDAFQWNFYLAETLFYSGQYMKAFDQYQGVRELDIEDASFEEIQQTSAFNAIKALELQLAQLIREGQIPANVLPGQEAAANTAPADTEGAAAAADTGIKRAQPKDIPPIVIKYITALDRFVVLNFKTDDPLINPKLAFQAAKLMYDFDHYESARRRFDWIIKNYNDSRGEQELAALAASLWLETYRVERDYAKLSELANQLKDRVDVSTIRDEIREYELAGLFKAAEAANNAKRYEEAVEKYLELVSRDTSKQYSARALNNAAVAYEALGRYDSAMKLFERVYKEYPNEPLSSYALYRIAVNAERFFEFDKSIQNYLAFYQRFATKETPKELSALDFTYDRKGADALKNAAILLEGLQEYDKAAARFEEFHTKYPKDADAEATAWRVVINHKKAKKIPAMIKAIETYQSRFGSASTADRYLEGTLMVADHYQETRKEKDARKWYSKALSDYVSLGAKPATPAAYFAAKAQFQLTEYEFAKWDAIKLKGNQAAMKKALDARITGQKTLTGEYEKVAAYQSLEWVMAAFFRIGNMYQSFAQALYDAPVPFREGTDEWDVYRQMLDDTAVPLEDEAVARYEKVAAQARQDKIVNEWTKKTLDELNKYKPQDYPLYKEERRELEERDYSGSPFLSGEQYKKMVAPKGARGEGKS